MTNAEIILRDVASYYTNTFRAFGPSARGVDWNGNASHQLRHRQFLRLIGSDLAGSVIDLGCGFGDFNQFLLDSGHTGVFTGYDICPEMIDAARKLYGQNERCRWHVGNTPTAAADFSVASGILNVKGTVGNDIWRDYVHQTIDILAHASRRGFAFNVLSLSSDLERRRPHLFYADPIEMLSYCLSRYGRNVALLQDYGLHEFTVVIHRTL